MSTPAANQVRPYHGTAVLPSGQHIVLPDVPAVARTFRGPPPEKTDRSPEALRGPFTVCRTTISAGAAAPPAVRVAPWWAGSPAVLRHSPRARPTRQAWLSRALWNIACPRLPIVCTSTAGPPGNAQYTRGWYSGTVPPSPAFHSHVPLALLARGPPLSVPIFIEWVEPAAFSVSPRLNSMGPISGRHGPLRGAHPLKRGGLGEWGAEPPQNAKC